MKQEAASYDLPDNILDMYDERVLKQRREEVQRKTKLSQDSNWRIKQREKRRKRKRRSRRSKHSRQSRRRRKATALLVTAKGPLNPQATELKPRA
jgi:hypothetical protein